MNSETRFIFYPSGFMLLWNTVSWEHSSAAGWPDYSLKLEWILGELSTYSLPLEIGSNPCSKTWEMNSLVCLEAHDYLLAHFWRLIF